MAVSSETGSSPGRCAREIGGYAPGVGGLEEDLSGERGGWGASRAMCTTVPPRRRCGRPDTGW
jgi:hypothetical protein